MKSYGSLTVCEFDSFYTGVPEANLAIAERCERKRHKPFRTGSNVGS
jgi:hypothetical protein